VTRADAVALDLALARGDRLLAVLDRIAYEEGSASAGELRLIAQRAAIDERHGPRKPTECSICRGVHISDDRHACE